MIGQYRAMILRRELWSITLTSRSECKRWSGSSAAGRSLAKDPNNPGSATLQKGNRRSTIKYDGNVYINELVELPNGPPYFRVAALRDLVARDDLDSGALPSQSPEMYLLEECCRPIQNTLDADGSPLNDHYSNRRKCRSYPGSPSRGCNTTNECGGSSWN